MKKQDILIVPDATGTAGAVTWWRLAGVVDYERLSAAWQDAGFDEDELPPPPSDTVALRRALRGYKGPRTRIEPLPSGGFAVVDLDFDDEDDEDPEYEVRFKVRLDYEALEMKFDREISTSEVDQIHELFERGRRELPGGAVGGWLVKQSYRHHGVALRDTGGIYFIPETGAARWSQIADLLASVSPSRIFEIPALRTERAVEAIMSSVITEISTAAEQLNESLANTESARGLRGRAAKLEALGDKLRLYEDLLGRQADEVRARLQLVDAKIVDALMVAEGE